MLSQQGGPQGRVGDHRELAGVCAFLASDDASFTSPLQIIKGGKPQIELKVILPPPIFLDELFIIKT